MSVHIAPLLCILDKSTSAVHFGRPVSIVSVTTREILYSIEYHAQVQAFVCVSLANTSNNDSRDILHASCHNFHTTHFPSINSTRSLYGENSQVYFREICSLRDKIFAIFRHHDLISQKHFTIYQLGLNCCYILYKDSLIEKHSIL